MLLYYSMKEWIEGNTSLGCDHALSTNKNAFFSSSQTLSWRRDDAIYGKNGFIFGRSKYFSGRSLTSKPAALREATYVWKFCNTRLSVYAQRQLLLDNLCGIWKLTRQTYLKQMLKNKDVKNRMIRKNLILFNFQIYTLLKKAILAN